MTTQLYTAGLATPANRLSIEKLLRSAVHLFTNHETVFSVILLFSNLFSLSLRFLFCSLVTNGNLGLDKY